MASAYLTRTPSGAGNGNTWTFSAWVKKSNLSTTQFLIGSSTSASDFEDIRFNANTGDLSYNRYLTNKQWGFDSSAYLRDVSGWYHVVVNRNGTTMNYYLNGVLQTKTNEVTSTSTGDFNTTDEVRIGGRPDTSSNTFDGLMTHVNFVDGTAYAPTSFGQSDSNGVWIPKPSPSVTYGTNGFFLKMDNSGNMGLDSGGGSNNFTTNGTITQAKDTPSNVFATLNPLVPYSGNLNFTNGNTTMASDGGGASWTTRWGVSTLGMSSGKYYAEAKVGDIGSNQMYALGLCRNVGTFAPSSSVAASGNNGLGYYSTGNIYTGGAFSNSDNDQTGVATFTTNDIIGLAFDRTNGTAQWYKNGSTVGNAVTGLSTDGIWHFVSNFYNTGTSSINFGNGYFGTTAVASAGTNASGNGIFEYDVPTGYTALSTKGLDS